MLVYANHLTARGAGARKATLKAVGAWLKEQLGYGLHPEQLIEDGAEFKGNECGRRAAWLRCYHAGGAEPELAAWVLKHSDDKVLGRQWVSEVGMKTQGDLVEMSCVVRTEEQSTLVGAPPSASQPRVFAYAVNNIRKSATAEFAPETPGLEPRHVGSDLDTYHALSAEIDRPERDYPIVLVSPAREGYLVDPAGLQERLLGLAQVVVVDREFNSYEMEAALGHRRSAWGGAINLIFARSRSGEVRPRLVRSFEIEEWGPAPRERISQILARITDSTNVPQLRNRIRPEGVTQLAQRRRFERDSAAMQARNARLGEDLARMATASAPGPGLRRQLAEIQEGLEDQRRPRGKGVRGPCRRGNPED